MMATTVDGVKSAEEEEPIIFLSLSQGDTLYYQEDEDVFHDYVMTTSTHGMQDADVASWSVS